MLDNIKYGENPQIEYFNLSGIDMVRIPYEITEISPSIFTWREISVKYINFNYGGLVDAIIELRYSPAEMTAIINNYLLDGDDENTKNEFVEMQNYRKYAKNTAKTILNNK